MTTTAGIFTSSVDAETWEPLIEDGQELGQVHWLVQAGGRPVAGLFRVGPEEGAELPYVVTGSDTFHAPARRSGTGNPRRRADPAHRRGHLLLSGRLYSHLAN